MNGTKIRIENKIKESLNALKVLKIPVNRKLNTPPVDSSLKIKRSTPLLLIPPESERYWGIMYYGARGSCKTLHQAKETRKILKYLKGLQAKYPALKPAILMTNQKLVSSIEKDYEGYLYYWSDLDDLKLCPRKNCWRGKKKHRLHGAYVVFDDISNILPPDSWRDHPMWFRKMLFQGRHFGIHCLYNLQDPLAVDVNVRRCTDVAYKFTKIIANRDPDETRKPVKFIFGVYRRRRINADSLWAMGDMPEQAIRMLQLQKDELEEYLKKTGKEHAIVYDNSWRGTYHYFTRKDTEIYDTLQDVKEYEPKGFMHKELGCIDPSHNHEDSKAPNYCGYKKVYHELI